MRTKSLTALAASALAFTLASHEAHAQRRRSRGSTEQPASNTQPANPPAATPPATTPTPATAPAAAPSTDTEPSPPAHASRRSGGTPSASANATLVSNVIERPGYHRTRVEAEIFASVGPGAWAWPWGGFVLSPGLRLSFPLTRNGPHASLNNDFRLVIGGQVYFSVTPIPYWWLSAPITLQWNFFLSEQWSVLLEAGVAVDVFTYDLINCYDHPRLYCDRVYFHPAGAFGLRRHLGGSGAPGAPSISFRFTYPGGVQVALGF